MVLSEHPSKDEGRTCYRIKDSTLYPTTEYEWCMDGDPYNTGQILPRGFARD